ncbi:hypothetical protein N4Q63_26925, partial [Leclercia adecarboxylata]|uniref:hypothetical protein n=1 Tax=Leclercia adecarboxylata TaxID=83655 RepID=UPI00234C4B8C|nr:hypothetical protein [Leclercia adecarboxylata]
MPGRARPCRITLPLPADPDKWALQQSLQSSDSAALHRLRLATKGMKGRFTGSPKTSVGVFDIVFDLADEVFQELDDIFGAGG